MFLFNTLRPKQSGWHVEYNIFECTSVNKISYEIGTFSDLAVKFTILLAQYKIPGKTVFKTVPKRWISCRALLKLNRFTVLQIIMSTVLQISDKTLRQPCISVSRSTALSLMAMQSLWQPCISVSLCTVLSLMTTRSMWRSVRHSLSSIIYSLSSFGLQLTQMRSNG